jgi:hypothetical protein
MVACLQLVHSNLCTASSRLVGCCLMPASFVGLRHFGHVSFIKMSKDIVVLFVVGPFHTPIMEPALSNTSGLYKSAHFALGLAFSAPKSAGRDRLRKLCRIAHKNSGYPPSGNPKAEPFCTASHGNNAYCSASPGRFAQASETENARCAHS